MGIFFFSFYILFQEFKILCVVARYIVAGIFVVCIHRKSIAQQFKLKTDPIVFITFKQMGPIEPIKITPSPM